MSDIETFPQLLKRAIKLSDKNNVEVAKELGVSPGAISHWLSGKTKVISPVHLQKLFEILPLDPDKALTALSLNTLPQKSNGQITVQGFKDNFVKIPDFASLEFSAGHGNEFYEQDLEEVDYVLYPMPFFQAYGINPEKCACYHVLGDSMEPTIKNGDRILVDKSQTDVIIDNGIYAIEIDNGLKVKRLIKQHDGSIIIKSDNSATYPNVVISAKDRDTYFKIIGRVIDSYTVHVRQIRPF